MTSYILWTAFTWTFKGILCTCRFLWICPYNAIKFLPRERHVTEDTSRQLKQLVGSESKAIPAIPGSPDRTTALHKRLTKTEKEILSLKTRVACERASWERRFGELQRKQEELCNQLASQAGVLVNVGGGDEQGEAGVDNGEAYEECSVMYQHRESEVSSRSDTYASSLSSRPSSSSSSSATSVRSWRMSKGPHRVFVPHSPMDLELGHRVRIMLPSGRISTGTIRFLGHLQGEADLHLGVELQTPDHGLHDGSHRGHSYFECKPGYGAFVPFHKLLMAWE
ncbi:CAP-Gly domain-containing linker protein 2 isoform X2 [Epinephelus fuscoguttatus]|uniref:CAP-Gly domain-containing linker protein 2 isoform X2 n=1 Tax=Epinephelus fuscoguttatus TaxID=293821 RepID=UPI0020D02C7E|nr:CAP-Gly domain-containing linker protein 2 isoform X2 [Epinephelus fuscoguttatus]